MATHRTGSPASPSLAGSSLSDSTAGSAGADVTDCGQGAAGVAVVAAVEAELEAKEADPGAAGGAGGGGGGAAAPPPARPEPPEAAACFPHLPPQLLAPLRESASDQEIENRFTAISIAFKTDRLTVEERLAVQRRWRDQAEQNLAHEEAALRAALQSLYHLCKDSTSIEIVTKVKEQVDILRMAVDWVARSSESLGAVQQERRVSCAVETMLQYVENLRRLRGDDAKRRCKAPAAAAGEEAVLPGDEAAGRVARLRALQGGSKRRASIAAIPRAAAEGSRLNTAATALFTEGRRRTSLAPGSSSAATGGSGEDHLDAFQTAASTLMDNIEETGETRRGSGGRLELQSAPPEADESNENNNNSVEQPCRDDSRGPAAHDPAPAAALPALRQACLDCARRVLAARLAAGEVAPGARRAAAGALLLAALCCLLAALLAGH